MESSFSSIMIATYQKKLAVPALSYVVPSFPSSLRRPLPASFSLFHVFPRRAVALLSLSVLLWFFLFPLLWQCRVEARALYRLANHPPLALKDYCLGSYHEKLGSWACLLPPQSCFTCPFSNLFSVALCSEVRLLFCCGLCFILVDEFYQFCDVFLAKNKAFSGVGLVNVPLD